MLPNTLVLNGLPYKKVSEDAQSGTVYQCVDSPFSRTNRAEIIVKHSRPARGKKGVFRHLVSFSTPLTETVDEVAMSLNERTTVNFTIAYPSGTFEDTSIVRTVGALAAFLYEAAGSPVELSDNALSILNSEF